MIWWCDLIGVTSDHAIQTATGIIAAITLIIGAPLVAFIGAIWIAYLGVIVLRSVGGIFGWMLSRGTLTESFNKNSTDKK